MINILIKVVCILVAVAYYTIAERKVMAAIQRRRGPNVVGVWGLLQPAADGLKLIAKEFVIPSHANSRIFVLAPIFVLALTFMTWGVIPFDSVDLSEYLNVEELLIENKETTVMSLPIGGPFVSKVHQLEHSDVADTRYGVLTVLAISGLSVYWICLAGWASNSKYAFLGALRSAAQMISYEVAVSLTILPVVCMAGSANFAEIVLMQLTTVWNCVPQFPMTLIFFISMVAETNRTPFDLPEAEAELVAGYNVEYSSITFSLFFLAEYGNMILAALLFVLLFLGGWIGGSMVVKGLVFCYLFILIRATLPRYRYDQLMAIGWKVFLPLATAYFVFTTGILYSMDAAPLMLGALLPTRHRILTTVWCTALFASLLAWVVYAACSFALPEYMAAGGVTGCVEYVLLSIEHGHWIMNEARFNEFLDGLVQTHKKNVYLTAAERKTLWESYKIHLSTETTVDEFEALVKRKELGTLLRAVLSVVFIIKAVANALGVIGPAAQIVPLMN